MVAGVCMKLALRLAPMLRRRIAFPLPLVNPDAETGDTSGWTNEQGVLAVRTANPPANQGGYYFVDATSAIHKSRQRVDVSTFAADIDAGLMTAVITWQQASYSSGDDKSACGIRFLNSAQTQISESIATEITPVPRMTWVYRSHSLSVPNGTRFIDALIKMTRAAGTANDGYTDDIKLALYK